MLAINQVVHMKAQLEIGLQVAERFMEKRCLMICGSEKSQSQGTTGLVRKVVAEASVKFEGVELSKMHHIAYIDYSKMGRLTVPDIDSCAKWTHKVLSMNDDFSHLAVLAFDKIEVFCYFA